LVFGCRGSLMTGGSADHPAVPEATTQGAVTEWTGPGSAWLPKSLPLVAWSPHRNGSPWC
jgi:hypothetical protein